MASSLRVHWLLLLSMLLPSAAAGLPFDLVIVAASGDVIGGKSLTVISSPSLNDSDEVAFRANFSDASGSSSGVFTQNRVVAEVGDTKGGKMLTGFSINPSLNDSGNVGYRARFPGPSPGTFRGFFIEDTLIAGRGDVIGGKTLTSVLQDPSLNNSGDIAFLADFTDISGSGRAVFVTNSVVAETGDTIGGKTLTTINNGEPSMNASGDVAFGANFSGGRGIFTQSILLVESGDMIAGRTITGVNDFPSLNDAGVVAFAAFTGFGTSGIFLTDGTTGSLIAHDGDVVDGKTLTVPFTIPSLNNLGQVVYGATFVGGTGIFVDDMLVAESGDVVDGRILASFGVPSLNDLGNVAFLAFFEGGGSGIILGTPIPEPSTVALLGIGLLGLTLFRRR